MKLLEHFGRAVVAVIVLCVFAAFAVIAVFTPDNSRSVKKPKSKLP